MLHHANEAARVVQLLYGSCYLILLQMGEPLKRKL